MRMSTKAHVYMQRHQGAKCEHKFSHGTFSYMLNGGNVNVMLEFGLEVYDLFLED